MTTKTEITQERAAFEAHFSKPPFEWEAHRYGEDSAWPGNYQNYDMQCAWEAWQARAAVETDCRDHPEGVRGMVPSDEEIASWVYLGQTIVDPDDVLGEAGFVRLIRAALSRYGSSQPAELAKCVGCEGHPAPENNPCAVCRQPAASAEPNAEARRALEIASDLRKDFRDDTHNYDTMLGAATLLESFAATAAPVAQEPVRRDWKAIDAATKAYLDGYELEGEGGSFYTPNSHERLILDDAIAGLLSDDDFMVLMAAPLPAQAQPSARDREDAVPNRDAVDLAREGMALYQAGMAEHIICKELVRIADAARVAKGGRP